MPALPSRLQIKLFVANPKSIDNSVVSALFQRWIQDKTLEGQLIDVADYRHVFQGPAVVLIGFDADYAIDNSGGRLGLLFTRKHSPEAHFKTQLRSSLRLALAAAQLLETEASLNPKPRFSAGEIEVRFPDRLQFPNTPETFAAVKDDLRSVFTEVYASDSVEIAPVEQDARYLFSVRVQSEAAFRISELAQYLQTSV
ncbi:MAG TPA: hypothetical protein VHD90_26765 [Phototrophicaceae bacterium]|nr:hypothetical protein [Phototrophicaceae bacterium]